MPLYCVVFLVAVFAKQFYLGTSGSFQIGDLLFMVSFVLMMVTQKRERVYSENHYLKVFIFAVFLINAIYSLIYSSFSFDISSLYYLFNFFVILTFEQAINNDKFLIYLERVLKLNLITQGIIYLLGKGTWYSNVRYQGTFNDPNQCGFFIFCCWLMIYIFMTMRGEAKLSIIWFFVSVFLIMPCASTGIALGYLIFLAGVILFPKKTDNGLKKILWLSLLISVGVIFVLLVNNVIQLPESFQNSVIYERTFAKFQKAQEGVLLNGDERGWNKIFDNPWMMIYGAGDGLFSRFGGSGKEVHSSILAPLFYYGIIPCIFLFEWHRRKLIGITRIFWCVYIALIVESVFLINSRQPMYWMIFVLASHVQLKSNKYMDKIEADSYDV